MLAPFSLPASGYRPDVWYWLLTACASLYSPSVARFRRVYDVGGPVQDAVFFRQNPEVVGPALPDWDMITYPQHVLIVLQGSTNFSQIVNQAFQLHQDAWAEGPGRVSPFYLEVGRQLYAQMESALRAKMPRNVVVAGHSFGGAAAQILAVLIRDGVPADVEAIVSFGAPKVGNRHFAVAYPLNLINVRHTGDIIVSAPGSSTFAAFVLSPIPQLGAAEVFRWGDAGILYELQPDGAVFNEWAGNTFPGQARSFVADWSFRGSVTSFPRAHSAYLYALRVRQNLPVNLRDLTRRLGWVDLPIVDAVNRDMAEYLGSRFDVRPDRAGLDRPPWVYDWRWGRV